MDGEVRILGPRAVDDAVRGIREARERRGSHGANDPDTPHRVPVRTWVRVTGPAVQLTTTSWTTSTTSTTTTTLFTGTTSATSATTTTTDPLCASSTTVTTTTTDPVCVGAFASGRCEMRCEQDDRGYWYWRRHATYCNEAIAEDTPGCFCDANSIPYECNQKVHDDPAAHIYNVSCVVDPGNCYGSKCYFECLGPTSGQPGVWKKRRGCPEDQGCGCEYELDGQVCPMADQVLYYWCHPVPTAVPQYIYPGVILTRNPDLTGGDAWENTGETVWVEEFNGLPLKVGCRYGGDLTGEYNERSLVSVHSVSEACGDSVTQATTTSKTCKGHCIWDFDGDLRAWVLTANCCESGGCDCPAPDYCPEDFDEAGCAREKTYCDNTSSQDSDLYCPTSTVTSSTTSSTSTTFDLGASVCGQGCRYKSLPDGLGGVTTAVIYDDCGPFYQAYTSSCSFEPGTVIGRLWAPGDGTVKMCQPCVAGVGDPCDYSNGACGLVDLPACTGTCTWVWPGTGNGDWVRTGCSCVGFDPADPPFGSVPEEPTPDLDNPGFFFRPKVCGCVKPGRKGDACGDIATTVCGACGYCTYRWDEDLAVWVQVKACHCGTCPEPDRDGEGDCDVIRMPCNTEVTTTTTVTTTSGTGTTTSGTGTTTSGTGTTTSHTTTTTTTTSSTTTTTTTTPPLLGCSVRACILQCDGGSGIWVLVDDFCDDDESNSCYCPVDGVNATVVCNMSRDGKQISTACQAITTTTSSTTTVTTTTADACPGNSCTYICDGGEWVLAADCPDGCVCPAAPGSTCKGGGGISFFCTKGS